MANAYIFNASGVDIYVSINGANLPFVVPAASSTTWLPGNPATQPTFVSNLNPGQGNLGLGPNTISLYSANGGSASSANFTLNIPENVTVSSFQLYLFWNDAQNVGWASLNGGQFIQVSKTASC